jgi:hypothetical protein
LPPSEPTEQAYGVIEIHLALIVAHDRKVAQPNARAGNCHNSALE